MPARFVALEQVHAGPAIEIDVATYGLRPPAQPGNGAGGTMTRVRPVWTPDTAPMILPVVVPPSCTVEIVMTQGGRRLAGAIELISPANKDRESKRRLFAAKCATYLARGVGLILVDVVTTRQANLHDELIALLGLGREFIMPADGTLYAVGYRPLHDDSGTHIHTWPFPLTLGADLPSVPLSLEAEVCVPVDLEGTYREACRRRRVDEAFEEG
jgi:hypothetical protein